MREMTSEPTAKVYISTKIGHDRHSDGSFSYNVVQNDEREWGQYAEHKLGNAKASKMREAHYGERDGIIRGGRRGKCN